jgi:hypothetical protein
MKILFAIPAYRGIKHHPFLDSMEATLKLCAERGHEGHMTILEGSCYLQTARNELVRAFMESECDTLFFLDDDISWPSEAALKLIEMPDEIVAGVYPFRTEEENYPVVIHTDAKHRPIVRPDGCIAAASVATGFLRIKRSAIERLQSFHPQQKYANYTPKGKLKEELYDLFPQGLYNGRWVGEDFAFCRLWAQALGEIWIVPDIDFEHAGSKGNYHRFLMAQPKG